VVDLSLNAQEVVAKDVSLSAVTAQGRLEWPQLQIASGTITGGEGEKLELRGGWNFKTKELLETTVTGQIRRQSIARWLPAQPGFDVVKIDAQAAGPLAEVNHRGKVEAAGVTASGINPLAIFAEWRGRGAAVESFEAKAESGTTRVIAGGAVEATGVKLTRLEFASENTPRLTLAAPAAVLWKPRLQIDAIRLAGPDGELTVSAALGETGRIDFAARGISSRWLADIVKLPGPLWQVSSIALMGTWDRGPMTFSLTAGAALDMDEGRKAAVIMAAQGDKAGLRVEALRATEGDATVVNASGRVPLTLSPGGKPFLHIDTNGPLAVDATVAPNAAFWQKLTAMSGVELQEPAASAHLTGTWQRPQGNAMLKAARIAIDPKRVNRPLPVISNLDVKVTGDPNGIALETFAIEVEGQPVRAQGKLPIPAGGWNELFKQPLAVARQGANLRLEVPEADVAVFARFLPAVLAPKGRLHADLTYRSGGVEGILQLQNAASRPLGPLGVLQEISADIALSGRKLALRGLKARSGGQPVELTGTIELPESIAAGAAPAAAQPRFDLALKGENLPFVRQTGLLVRGDLDLKLQTPPSVGPAAPPRLSGTVRLRDSLFLSDVRSFLPRGGAGPTRRPPYFAVETPPANAWVLAVDLVGEEFMRLRTPVFTGVASARFRLGGTLGEPRAIGEVSIDEGHVRMPFASFEVQQGWVRLTESDPYEPTIYLRGTGRRYEHDLTMEIDGKAAGPNVTFTSSPALDSEQLLLMVMTGAAPENAAGKSSAQRFAGVGYFLGQSLVGNLLGTSDQPERLTFQNDIEKGKETYLIEYKLSNRWTLTGEKNEYEEYNAGVKWRVFGGKKEEGSKANAKK
jgi:translocation and assembly module TamB